MWWKYIIKDAYEDKSRDIAFIFICGNWIKKGLKQL